MTMRIWTYSSWISVLSLALVLGCSVATSSQTAAAATDVPAPPGAANPQLPSFLNATVQNVTPDALTLVDGATFRISQATMFYRLKEQTTDDLSTGDYVRITARPQSDGGLLASQIVVPVGLTQNFPPFQFPIGGGELMNTARITTLDAGGMTIALASGDVHVTFAPEIDIRREVVGSLADVNSGSAVLVVSHPDRTDAIEIYQ
jgi:Domain of unknown function (DUF5666)